MKITSIIAEYNPFHNGHKYHIEESKRLTSADYIIVVMSGDFVQRGTPAVIDKHVRASMALLNGADLVLELPTVFACGSAEYFATGSVALLDALHAVDCLCFGSECASIENIRSVSQILLEEPTAYRMVLKEELRKGLSFPAARVQAMESYLNLSDKTQQTGNHTTSSVKTQQTGNHTTSSVKTQQIGSHTTPSCKTQQTDSHTATSDMDIATASALLSSPNNILGIEYIKALLSFNSSITPYTIARLGAGYHEDAFSNIHSSATSIRSFLCQNTDLSVLKSHVPASVYDIMEYQLGKTFPIFPNDISSLLKYKLLLDAKHGYASYLDVSDDLSNRIQKQLHQFTDFETFCELLKTKELTYTRISRCLTHILLDIKNAHAAPSLHAPYVPYARILGLKKSASPLLNKLKQTTSIPLISKLADAKSLLPPKAYSMLLLDIKAAHIYDLLVSEKFGTAVKNEYAKPLSIIP